MNTRCYMVIIKGEIKTSEIMSCGYNRNTQKWDVKFNNGKTYSYAYLNVEKLTDPEVLNPNMYRISREGREFFDVNAIYVFRSGSESYWHICFGDGSERDYRRNDLHIIESCLAQSQSSNVFEYIKQIAGLSNLKNEETGEKLLSKKFDKISFVGSDVALAKYLNPSLLQEKRIGREYIPIFPFGCNNSQYKAVKNAMENQISVIQGPPGTGKTQTILNIIANILMQGKTVQIVSNNNSATENVYEKLSSPKYNLGFVAATLGSSKNKKLFVEHQDAAYPDFSSWKTGEDPSVLQKGIAEQSSQLKSVFDKQEKLACLRQELSQLVTEQEYFNQYVKESDVHTDSIKFKKKLSSKQWMVLWQESQLISEEKTAIGFWFKLKALFKYGVTDWSISKRDISKRKAQAKAIFDSFNVSEGYQYTNSFLQSILDVMPNVTQTLLREHYRCHPKIINFCNQKFYRGELIIMTTDKGEEDVLSVVKTVAGNHERNHYSQRQIDVIKNEIIPKYVSNPEETGIITPYKNQVEALSKEITDIDAATVHKFQGKEKENIIISTVDDEISDFADDPYLINVAVSRAKKKLMLVVTGNEQSRERNITELIDYIQYNNFEVTESKIYSIFDYLYKQYTEERRVYLQKHKKVSEYDSENLMYSLIEDIISANKYSSLDVVCHFPLNMLIKNPELLNEQECQYAMNPATHLDFLIYNRIGKKPVLAIEVDGYEYHKEDTVQASRDLLKNHIMELYEIPLLRFMTNGSGEKEKIIEMLDKLVG